MGGFGVEGIQMKRSRVLSVLVGVGAIVAIGNLPAATAAPQTEPFEFTGDAQEFVVPDGVTEVQVEACGAQGGRGATELVDPGLGARVLTTLAVTPGETLQVNVGGAGGDGTDVPVDRGSFLQSPGGTGGFNGGGGGGDAEDSDDLASGGGGGGASDVRQGGTDIADRVIVAAGGGGSGAWTEESDDFPDGPPGTGGDGGTEGEDGANQPFDTPPGGGTGATQTDPGLGGSGDYDGGNDGDSSNPAEGGNGGVGEASDSNGGGGGGGGLFGGGGGGSADQRAAGGGGGGSSEPAGGTVTEGDCSGNGLVEITYEVPEAPAAPAEEGPIAAEPGFTG